MKDSLKRVSALIFVALFVVGLTLILTASSRGQNNGNTALRRHGGSMETVLYNRVIEESTTDYRIAGVIMAVIGGYGMVNVVTSLRNDSK